MAEQTEAACLLKTGALYLRRIGLKDASGAIVFAGFKHGAFSMYCDDAPIFHFDLEGRWQRAFIDGTHQLKALDGSVEAIDRPREGANMVLKRRRLSFADAADLDAFIRDAALRLIEEIRADRFAFIDPPAPTKSLSREDLLDFLEKIVGWDSAAWFAHRERYSATYGPLPFLPPDGQNALILQATIGEASGFSFGLAPAEERIVRSPEEFKRHLRDVGRFLGKRIAQCRGVFLGGSDVLRRPVDDIEAYLTAIAEAFPIDPTTKGKRLTELGEDLPRLDGISTVLDDFRPQLPNAEDLKRFRNLHLRRVFLGVESGDPEIRAIFGKTWGDDSFRGFVDDLKTAEIDRAILVLDAPGGNERLESHVEKTADLLASLALGRGDPVYLLNAEEVGGAAFRACLADHSLSAVPPAIDRVALFKQALARVGITIIPYSLEKQGGIA